MMDHFYFVRHGENIWNVAMEVLKNDSKPNVSLLEAVLSNKEVKKVFTDMIKTGLKK